MRGNNAYLRGNMWLKLDYLFGLRAFGLVIYGALPASLGALGAFKAPDQSLLDSKIGAAAIPYILCVALIPVVLTFVLVRQRLANWYLLPVCLSVRAAAITLAIVVASSIVVGANGLLVGTYQLVSVTTWKTLPLREKIGPSMECLLMSFAYLVGSSTLFLTVVKEDGSLPLLPNKREVEGLRALRDSLKDATSNPLYAERPLARTQQLTDRVAALTAASAAAGEALQQLNTGFTGLGRRRFYAELASDLSNLKSAAEDVGNSNLTWPYYWASDFNVDSLGKVEQSRRASVERLRGLDGHA